MKVVITFTFCYDNLWKSKFMALKKPGKLGIFFSYFVATMFSHNGQLSILPAGKLERTVTVFA